MNQNDKLRFYRLKELAAYKIHGRTDESQDPLPLFFQGSGIEVNVTGTELWIEIEVDFDVYEMWAWKALNGAFMSRQMLMPGTYSLCLFRGMSPEPVKNVRFFRELQAMSEDDGCRLLVRGFRSDGEFLPVRESSCKLEFIGDSITSGEGLYGAREDMDWLAMYMGNSRNYTHMVADALDAECRLLSQGGWGVLCGWDNDLRHNIPSCYEKICGLAKGGRNEALGTAKPYDFNSWIPDAVIVNLGTNDAGAFDQPAWIEPVTGETFAMRRGTDGNCPSESVERFRQAVIDFLSMIRRNNPVSHILWVYGMLGDELAPVIREAMDRYEETTGDRNTAFLLLPDTTEETYGSRQHPGEKAHVKAAEAIVAHLKKIIGRKQKSNF